MTLYELSQMGNEIFTMLESEEIDEQTFNDTLEGMGFDEKVEQCAYIVKELSAQVDAIKNEIQRLQAKKKSTENNIQRLKDNLTFALNSVGQKKVDKGTYIVRISKSQSVEIVNPETIPEAYKFIEQNVKIDKKGIKEAIKSGEDIQGAILMDKESVVIK